MPRQQSSVSVCLRVRARVCLCACTHITAWEIPTSGSHVTELFPAGPAGRAWRTVEGQECVSSLGSTELTLWHQSSGSLANAGLLSPGEARKENGAQRGPLAPGSLHNCGEMGASSLHLQYERAAFSSVLSITVNHQPLGRPLWLEGPSPMGVYWADI